MGLPWDSWLPGPRVWCWDAPGRVCRTSPEPTTRGLHPAQAQSSKKTFVLPCLPHYPQQGRRKSPSIPPTQALSPPWASGAGRKELLHTPETCCQAGMQGISHPHPPCSIPDPIPQMGSAHGMPPGSWARCGGYGHPCRDGGPSHGHPLQEQKVLPLLAASSWPCHGLGRTLCRRITSYSHRALF